jgi:hypothetical protein
MSNQRAASEKYIYFGFEAIEIYSVHPLEKMFFKKIAEVSTEVH